MNATRSEFVAIIRDADGRCMLSVQRPSERVAVRDLRSVLAGKGLPSVFELGDLHVFRVTLEKSGLPWWTERERVHVRTLPVQRRTR